MVLPYISGRVKLRNFDLSKELLMGKLLLWKIEKADILRASPSVNGEGLMLKTSAFQIFHSDYSTFISLLDKDKFSNKLCWSLGWNGFRVVYLAIQFFYTREFVNRGRMKIKSEMFIVKKFKNMWCRYQVTVNREFEVINGREAYRSRCM